MTPAQECRVRKGRRGGPSGLDRRAVTALATETKILVTQNELSGREQAMAEGLGGFTKARLEAFSDGVIAVIITIMVLELKAPGSARLEDLLRLWPGFAIYAVSFMFIAIYWINHHSLLNLAKSVTAPLIWANNLLLFFMSLIPFATAYVAATRFAPMPTMVYGALQFLCGAGFNFTLMVIVAQRRHDREFIDATRARRRKNWVSLSVYALSVVVAGFSPLGALALFIAIAIAYVAPSLFARTDTEGAEA